MPPIILLAPLNPLQPNKQKNKEVEEERIQEREERDVCVEGVCPIFFPSLEFL